MTISLRKEKHDVHRTIKLRQTTGWAAPDSEAMEQIAPTSGEMDGNGWKPRCFCGTTDADRNTIKDKFTEQIGQGLAELHGKGRGAHYRPAGS